MTDLILHQKAPDSLQDKIAMAEIMAGSNIIPSMSKGKPYTKEDIVSLFLIGERLGIDPVSALSGIYIVEGKPTISARLSRALIRKNGHSFRVIEHTAQIIKIEAIRQGEDPHHIEFKIEEAHHAGLTSRKTWAQYPKQMLLAAATRRMVDIVFPDLFLGMTAYDPDEFDQTPVNRARSFNSDLSLKSLKGSEE